MINNIFGFSLKGTGLFKISQSLNMCGITCSKSCKFFHAIFV